MGEVEEVGFHHYEHDILKPANENILKNALISDIVLKTVLKNESDHRDTLFLWSAIPTDPNIIDCLVKHVVKEVDIALNRVNRLQEFPVMIIGDVELEMILGFPMTLLV